MGKVCTKDCNICCRLSPNILKNDLFVDNNYNEFNDINDLQKIIIIQSAFRSYITRKKMCSTNIMKSKEISMDYSTEKFEKNQIIVRLNQLFPKFELSDKEYYEINNSNNKIIAILYPNKSIYKGMVNEKGLKEGFGKYYLSDGSIYKGFFHENRMEGRGRFININGFIYEGEFKNGLSNGYGKYAALDGTIYKGTWSNNKQNGLGEEIYHDGSHYNGCFKDGKKWGNGKFVFHDQNIYDGNFINNEINGEGAYYWKDGRIYIGTWLENKMNGYGIFIWPDKKKYHGGYINNLKEGFGIFFWNDGHKYEGFWKEGKQHGYGIIISSNGVKYGQWFSGKFYNKIEDDVTKNLINQQIEKIKKEKDYIQFSLKIEKYEKQISDGSSSQETGNGNGNFFLVKKNLHSEK